MEISLPLLASLPPGYTARFEASGIDDTGQARGEWIVFPTPGFAGWWLRVRYRCFFQWVEKLVPLLPTRFAAAAAALLRPRIEVKADIAPGPPPTPPTVH